MMKNYLVSFLYKSEFGTGLGWGDATVSVPSKIKRSRKVELIREILKEEALEKEWPIGENPLTILAISEV